MRKYGESETTRIMMATVPHVTSGLGLRKFQADGFLLTRVYNQCVLCTVGSHITYRVHAKTIKNIKKVMKVKILLVMM